MTNEQPHKPLDQQSFNTIASAFARLQMLGDKQIDAGPTDNTAAEREQLIAFLATEMMKNLGEFLGAWQLCNLEYLPLLRSLRGVATRVGYAPTPQASPTSPAPSSNN